MPEAYFHGECKSPFTSLRGPTAAARSSPFLSNPQALETASPGRAQEGFCKLEGHTTVAAGPLTDGFMSIGDDQQKCIQDIASRTVWNSLVDLS